MLEDQPRGAAAAPPTVTEDSNNPAPGKAASAHQRQPRGGAATPLAALPLWHGKLGGRRLAAELKAVTAAFEAGQLPQVMYNIVSNEISRGLNHPVTLSWFPSVCTSACTSISCATC